MTDRKTKARKAAPACAPTPASIDQARRLYEQTDAPVKDIAESLGLHWLTLHQRMAGWGWRPRSAPAASKPAAAKKSRRKRPAVPQADAQPAPDAEPPSTPVQGQPERPHSWQGQPCTGLPACPERTMLIAQLWSGVERQITRIDAAQSAAATRGRPPVAADAEAYAKLVASLARSLRELAQLDAALQDRADGEKAARGGAPLDRDAFRLELAQRLAAFEAQESEPAAQAAADDSDDSTPPV